MNDSSFLHIPFLINCDFESEANSLCMFLDYRGKTFSRVREKQTTQLIDDFHGICFQLTLALSIIADRFNIHTTDIHGNNVLLLAAPSGSRWVFTFTFKSANLKRPIKFQFTSMYYLTIIDWVRTENKTLSVRPHSTSKSRSSGTSTDLLQPYGFTSLEAVHKLFSAKGCQRQFKAKYPDLPGCVSEFGFYMLQKLIKQARGQKLSEFVLLDGDERDLNDIDHQFGFQCMDTTESIHLSFNDRYGDHQQDEIPLHESIYNAEYSSLDLSRINPPPKKAGTRKHTRSSGNADYVRMEGPGGKRVVSMEADEADAKRRRMDLEKRPKEAIGTFFPTTTTTTNTINMIK
jgi:hypothetical protein